MILSNKNLQKLIKKSNNDTKLSIYIPTHPASTSPTLLEDTIRFKNALQKIKTNKKYNKSEFDKTIKKLELLFNDKEFWKNRTMGLAVFADKNGYETVDLNYEITEMQYVQDDYIISPLAIMLSIGTGYYVLDINHINPRLVYFTSTNKEIVATESMPGSFEETVEREEYQKQLQHQSATGSRFHGHTETAALDEDTLRYYKIIANSVDNYLVDHNEPLLLTGTANRIGHMRPLLSYKNVLKESIEGNNEDLNEQELYNITSTTIENVDIDNRDELVANMKNTPPDRLVIGSVDIKTAIADGRVETLFLSSFRRTADNIRDGSKATIVLQLLEDIKTIESLVRGVLLQGGNVVAVKQGSFDNDEPRALCRF